MVAGQVGMIIADRRVMAPIRQLGTHRRLISGTEHREINAPLALDAVVVPASRPAQNIDLAVTLARAARSALLVLCSYQTVPAEVTKLLAERSFDDAIVINLADAYDHELISFPALASIKGELPAACSYFTTDLSTKRNLSLLLARKLGWRRIFFLDDDIREIEYQDLHNTVSMLARYQTAGMRVTEFPDNSAACHAHRLTGGPQDVFLSGAAMAVNTRQRRIGFFPDIYNEDWLFFYDDAAKRKLGSSGREIRQLRYNPFADPDRAAWQEFGDTLAEGLYALLDRDLGVEHASSDYWNYFLYARQSFLRAIIRRAGAAKLEIREQLTRSVQAALDCSATITPELLERYISLWRQDLRTWQRRVAELDPAPSVEIALKELGLEPSADGGPTQAAGLGPARLAEEPPTTPYNLLELYELLSSDTYVGRSAGTSGKWRGWSTKWIDIFRNSEPQIGMPSSAQRDGRPDGQDEDRLTGVGPRHQGASSGSTA